MTRDLAIYKIFEKYVLQHDFPHMYIEFQSKDNLMLKKANIIIFIYRFEVLL